jgi:Uma2 family endonuclease
MWTRARTWGRLSLMAANHAAHRHYTIQEFVRLEEYSNVRHEYLEGQIYAMAGGTPEHGARAANVIGIWAIQLRGRPCRVQTSDVRIRVTATGLDTYPDVSVVCGHAESDREDPDAIVNPIVLVEILSPSTEAYDKGEKLDHYKRLASLQEVVLVAHDRPHLVVVRRQGDGWTEISASEKQTLRLESIGCNLSVDDVYLDPLA